MDLLREYRQSLAEQSPPMAVGDGELAEIETFLSWLAAAGQPNAVSRTALVQYRASLVEDDTADRASVRARLAPVRRFVTWYEAAHPTRSLVGVGAGHDDRLVAELQTLKTVAETLNQAVEVEEAVDAALAEVTALLGLGTGWVFLLDDSDSFVPVASIGLPPGLAENDQAELRRRPDCECQWQLRTGALKRAVNIVKCSRLAEAPGDTGGLCYHASIPIRARKRVVGILNVTAPSQQIFHSADLQVLGAIGDQLGMAIERARLLDVARSRRLREQDVLLRLSHGLLSSLDPQQMTEMVVQEAAGVLGADAASFLLFTTENRLSLVSTVGWQEEYVAGLDLTLLPGALTDQVVRAGRPVLKSDLSTGEEPVSDVVEAHGWRSALAVPVELGGERIGVLAVYSLVPSHFNADDTRLLGLIAAQAALAVHNAREYEEKAEEAWLRNALLQVAENVRDDESVDDVLETVGRIAPLFLGANHCGFYVWNAAEQRFTPRRLVSAVELSEEQEARFYAQATAEPGAAFDRLLLTRHPLLLERTHAAPGDLALLDLFGANRVLLAPLIARSLLVGAMALDLNLAADRFTPRLLEIASGIANQTAIAVENQRLREAELEAERLAQELELARHIQRSFLPDYPPDTPGWDICQRWEPARTVTGDFYDFVRQSDGRLGVVIADVSDKGAPAAIFMAVSRSLLRASIMATDLPASAITQANRLIAADAESSMFVTAFYVALSAGGAAHYVNAGHNPPLLVRADGQAEWLGEEVHGPVLGVLPDVLWVQEEATLGPGDMLILYTDGVTEAVDRQLQPFGEDRLLATALAYHHGSAREMTEQIVAAVNAFTAGQPPFDDITLVVVKRVP